MVVLSDAISDVIVKMKDVVSSTLAFTSNCNICSEVGILLQLIYVLPVTTVSAEGSFSSLRRLKTYFRTTMSTQRLNHLMHLSVHRYCTESLNVQKIASEFVSRNQKRQIVFGKVWRVSNYVFCLLITRSAVARVSEAPPEISRGAPHTLLAYYYELQ